MAVISFTIPDSQQLTDVEPTFGWFIVTKDKQPLFDSWAPTWDACIKKSMGKTLDVQEAWAALQQAGYTCVKIFFTGLITEHAPE